MNALQIFLILWFAPGACLAPFGYARTEKYWEYMRVRGMEWHCQLSVVLLLFCWLFIFPILHYTKIDKTKG